MCRLRNETLNLRAEDLILLCFVRTVAHLVGRLQMSLERIDDFLQRQKILDGGHLLCHVVHH